MPFIILKKVSSVLCILRILNRKSVELYQMHFLYFLRCHFFFSFFTVNMVHYIDFPMLNKPCIPGVNYTLS